MYGQLYHRGSRSEVGQNCERTAIRFERAARLLTVIGKAGINRMAMNAGEMPVPPTDSRWKKRKA